MTAVSLAAIRDAIDEAGRTDTATFARRARNAIAQAVVGEALAHDEPEPPAHDPPVDELRRHVGADLADRLAALYAGDRDWTSHAIEALAPLNALARQTGTTCTDPRPRRRT
jgi:hypothetical protein